MGRFEYLSVLLSIIIGLGISHLLSSAARLIQARKRVRFYAPTAIWMCFLLLVQIQVWWVGFERADQAEWQFFVFVLYLLIPIGVFLLSYLIVPDLEGAETIDLRSSYLHNRAWLFGILAVVLLVSLADESIENGAVPTDLDALMRVVFLLFALLGVACRGERAHLVLSVTMLASFTLYIVLLFLRLG